jgi:predicted unusual protein kinase regulating ubiquinone biosynthesis (AarF/ABC1/UbiB family)
MQNGKEPMRYLVWLSKHPAIPRAQGMTPGRVVERKAELAAWLREGLVRLGPTFIKIGQQFSTRVDVLSPEFIKELEKLQVRHFVARSTEPLANILIIT